jgi:hypothetical protein
MWRISDSDRLGEQRLSGISWHAASVAFTLQHDFDHILVELLVERLASQNATAINMNEWQKLGSRQGVSNDRIWVFPAPFARGLALLTNSGWTSQS